MAQGVGQGKGGLGGWGLTGRFSSVLMGEYPSPPGLGLGAENMALLVKEYRRGGVIPDDRLANVVGTRRARPTTPALRLLPHHRPAPRATIGGQSQVVWYVYSSSPVNACVIRKHAWFAVNQRANSDRWAG